MKVVNQGILKGFVDGGVGTGVSVTEKLIVPVLIATLIVVALSKAKDFAEGMAGEFGKLGAKVGGAVMGVAGGVALGGAAVAGRKVIGGAAQKLENSGALKKLPPGMSKFAMNLNDKARKGTWDARGTKLGGKAIGATGVNMGTVGAGARGGYEGIQKRQDTSDIEHAKRLEKMSDTEKENWKNKEVAGHKEAVGRLPKERKDADAALEIHQAAKLREEKTDTYKAVGLADTAKKAQEEALAKTKKKTEEAQKARDTARDTGIFESTNPQAIAEAAKVSKGLADATKEEQDALKNFQDADTALTKASQTHATSVEGITAATTGATVAATQKKLAATQATLKSATEKADKMAEGVTTGRMNKFADHVEGRSVSHVGGADLDPRYSQSQAKSTADAIRKRATPEERKKNKEKDETYKTMKKMMAEIEKEKNEGSKDKPEGGTEKKPGESTH